MRKRYIQLLLLISLFSIDLDLYCQWGEKIDIFLIDSLQIPTEGALVAIPLKDTSQIYLEMYGGCVVLDNIYVDEYFVYPPLIEHEFLISNFLYQYYLNSDPAYEFVWYMFPYFFDSSFIDPDKILDVHPLGNYMLVYFPPISEDASNEGFIFVEDVYYAFYDELYFKQSKPPVVLPAVPPIPRVVNDCGSSTLLRPSPSSGVTYYWQTSPTGTKTSNSSAEYIVTTSGVYYLRSRTADGVWSSSSSSVAVTVKKEPTVYFLRMSSTYIELSGSELGVSYQLMSGTTLVGAPKLGTGGSLVWKGLSTYGDYLVNATGPDGCEVQMKGIVTLHSPHNYVKTTELQVECTKEDEINKLTKEERNITYQYFDGMSRPIQTVYQQLTPSGYDLVEFNEYYFNGKETRSYLPYPSSSESGKYKNIAPAAQEDFYQSYLNIGKDQPYAYSEKLSERSALNRLKEQGSPGASWQIDRDSYSNSSTRTGNTIRLTNRRDKAGEVIIWKVDLDNSVSKYTIETPISLTVTEILDENGNKSAEFKDISGNVILKKAYLSATDSVETYYIYDAKGLLRYVLPPKAVDNLGSLETLTPTTDLVKNLCYYYEYDYRNRMVIKQLPGAERVFMVYDKQDRLVLTQDGNMKNACSPYWLFTKYDVFNRPVMTGEFHTDSLQSSLQNSVNAMTGINLYEDFDSQGVHGYSNRSFPNVSDESKYLTVMYYDDYSLLRMTGFGNLDFVATELSGLTKFDKVKGQLTGSKTRVLDGTGSSWLYSVNYYDDRYRVIQNVSTNYLGGKDIASNEYNFSGNVTRAVHSHTAGTTDIKIEREMEYDHAGRLERVYQTVSGDYRKARTLISEMTYNELGELVSKKLHEGMQDENYTYNIRGWLTSINDPDNLQDDIFGLKLLYNDISAKGSLAGKAMYNGNISGMIWNVKDVDANSQKRVYGFEYDGLNRLKSADYGDYEFGSLTDYSNKFNVENLSYDKNGNILSLKRFGNGSVIDDLAYGYKEGSLSNMLDYVNDVHGTTEGFQNGGSGSHEYSYDVNGNMIKDDNKGLSSIDYNMLNLPKEITKGTTTINYVYDALGNKLENSFSLGKKVIYLGSFVYEEEGGVCSLKYVLTDEGRLLTDGGTVQYEYYLKDHLGNVRATFRDTDGNITQYSHYYPFGMRFGGASSGSSNNKYLYNGKELQELTDWLDYGWRMNQPELGRWFNVDPMAESYYSQSPYHFSGNNPIRFVDLNGMSYDGYTIDEYGNINRVDDTGGDEYDVLYTKKDYDQARLETKETGEKNEFGNPEPGNSVRVSVGIFSEATTFDFIGAKGFEISNEADAKAIFKFAADNFSVEFGMVSGISSDLNRVTTHIIHTSGKTDYIELGLVVSFMNARNDFITETYHSHPGDDRYDIPSGYYPNGKPQKPLRHDAAYSKSINDINGFPVIHYMYHPKSGHKYIYNPRKYVEIN